MAYSRAFSNSVDPGVVWGGMARRHDSNWAIAWSRRQSRAPRAPRGHLAYHVLGGDDPIDVVAAVEREVQVARRRYRHSMSVMLPIENWGLWPSRR